MVVSPFGLLCGYFFFFLLPFPFYQRMNISYHRAKGGFLRRWGLLEEQDSFQPHFRCLTYFSASRFTVLPSFSIHTDFALMSLYIFLFFFLTFYISVCGGCFPKTFRVLLLWTYRAVTDELHRGHNLLS